MELERELKEQLDSEGGEQQQSTTETEPNPSDEDEKAAVAAVAATADDSEPQKPTEESSAAGGTAGEALEKIVEEDEGLTRRDTINIQSSTSMQLGGGGAAATTKQAGAVVESHSSIATASTSVLAGTQLPSLVPRKGLETHEFLEGVKKTNDLLKSIQSQVVSLTGLEPGFIDISGDKSVENDGTTICSYHLSINLNYNNR